MSIIREAHLGHTGAIFETRSQDGKKSFAAVRSYLYAFLQLTLGNKLVYGHLKKIYEAAHMHEWDLFPLFFHCVPMTFLTLVVLNHLIYLCFSFFCFPKTKFLE